ncbi:dienelactone hydrolase family protein [Nocardiopsis metallicus]|uniref:Dienelactone hydrolase domain-containing protein n=1 Tax=Nocardiopsis metallicus TaxID=179819 RepID=A0A840WWB1_9ACTN|nr:dienelactone hydrolase family protein [Nocardiopsis metallicus]MBB5494448.1 hypothetical protein [Nocardiopsis metallicus]
MARPEGNGPWPGAVVAHEAFGVDEQMRLHADRMARAGYLTVVPDLYSDGGMLRCVRRDAGAVGPVCRRRPVASGAMGIQIDAGTGYPNNNEMERALELVEEVGEPVTVTFTREGRAEEGRARAERAVLVPAATLARWEHWARSAYPAREAGDENRAEPETPELAHPAKVGAFTFFRRCAGGRTAIARKGAVVAELLDSDEAHWLQVRARRVREGFMDPKQKVAFEEFLARQPPVGRQ